MELCKWYQQGLLPKNITPNAAFGVRCTIVASRWKNSSLGEMSNQVAFLSAIALARSDIPGLNHSLSSFPTTWYPPFAVLEAPNDTLRLKLVIDLSPARVYIHIGNQRRGIKRA